MLRIAAVVAFAGVGLMASGCASTASSVAAAPGAAEQSGAIPGLRMPRDGLLTSGQPAASAWKALADDGVVAVVNLRPDAELRGRDERAEVAAAGMAYHHLPIAGADDLAEADAAQLWRIVESAPGRVLVHCASGNRAGALLALGAAQTGVMSPVDALAFGKSAGLTSPGLEAAVRERLGLPAAATGDRDASRIP